MIAVEKWDRRRLAYEVAGRREGIYILMYFTGEPKAASELDRVMRISEDVMRHLITRAEPGQSAEAKQRTSRPAPEPAEEAAAAAEAPEVPVTEETPSAEVEAETETVEAGAPESSEVQPEEPAEEEQAE